MCQCLDSHLVEFLMGLYRGHHRQSQPGMSTNQGTKCWMSCTSFGASCRWVSSDLVWRVGYPWATWKPWAPDPGLPSCRSTSKPSWWPALAHPSWCRGSMLDPWTAMDHTQLNLESSTRSLYRMQRANRCNCATLYIWSDLCWLILFFFYDFYVKNGDLGFLEAENLTMLTRNPSEPRWSWDTVHLQCCVLLCNHEAWPGISSGQNMPKPLALGYLWWFLYVFSSGFT